MQWPSLWNLLVMSKSLRVGAKIVRGVFPMFKIHCCSTATDELTILQGYSGTKKNTEELISS